MQRPAHFEHEIGDSVLYHSLSALPSAEVNFWFTCRRKRLVAQADGCGERCPEDILSYIGRRLRFERTTSSATTASASFRFQRLRRRHIHPFPRINCMKASIFFVI